MKKLLENRGNADHSPSRAIEQARTRPKDSLIAAAQADVVIDTNVALDWLVFAEPRVRPLRDAVESGRLRWLATRAMRDELARMLAHRSLAGWAPDADAALALFDRLVLCLEAPAGAGLRCRDPDDQVFVDLALARRARWLFTRDRALLALARKARPAGLAILTPAQWAMAESAAP